MEQAITELRVGEALVSTLMEDGAPSIVQRSLIKPPRSRLGPVTEKERAIIQSISPFAGKYDEEVDRESAEEVLLAKAANAAEVAKEVEATSKEEVAKHPRKTKTMWEKATSAATRAVVSSAALIVVSKITGKKSRTNPAARAASAAAGSIGTSLGGSLLGSFARNIMGGLMR